MNNLAEYFITFVKVASYNICSISAVGKTKDFELFATVITKIK